MPKKTRYMGNYPNSPNYDPNLPTGYFEQLASYYEDDSEDCFVDEDEEEIELENETENNGE